MHKYEAVAAGIRELISGSLAPHDALPSERELMLIYGVSRMTVRQAIAKLADEGRVYNLHGSGTYAGSVDLFSKSPKLTSFTEDMTSRGYQPSSKVLAVARVRANDEVANSLQIPVGAECTKLHRLRLADGNPMAIEEVYLLGEVFDVDDFTPGESLYHQLSANGHEILRAEQEIRAITVTAEESLRLEVPEGTSALCVTRVSSSRRGQLIEYARTIYRGDRYTFQLAVTRESEK